jgi:hypothetical protein
MAVIDAAIGGLGFKTMTPSLGAGLIALCSIWVFTYALSLAPIGESSQYGSFDFATPVDRLMPLRLDLPGRAVHPKAACKDRCGRCRLTVFQWDSVCEFEQPKPCRLSHMDTAPFSACTDTGATLTHFALIFQSYTVPLMLSAQYAGWGTKIGLFFAGTSVLCWVPCYFLFPEVSDEPCGIISTPSPSRGQ